MNGIEVTKDTMKNVARLYMKKPLAIRAMQINQTFWAQSLEGNHQGKEGDYLIEGIKGELYICDKEIFEQSYDLYYSEWIASKQALSANNAKWRDKANYLITFYRDKAKGEVFRERYRYESMAVALENLLSQMEEE